MEDWTSERMNFAHEGFVVSHPFHKKRGKDGARAAFCRHASAMKDWTSERMNFAHEGFVVSHPFRKKRGKDGARGSVFQAAREAGKMRSILAFLFIVGLPANGQDLPAVPDNLKPPASAKMILEAHATGDQIYACDGSNWVLSRPDAKLFDETGKQIGTHFAGPTWELNDGSRVIGKAVANATPDPDSIPWLLVEARGHQGDGLMARVAFVQRLSTSRGKAPAGGCDAEHKGQETRSHYTAIYVFYAAP